MAIISQLICGLLSKLHIRLSITQLDRPKTKWSNNNNKFGDQTQKLLKNKHEASTTI